MSTQRDQPDASATVVEEVIRDAGALAVETKDFVSYATVLELRMGGPENYTTASAFQVLNALYETLVKYDALTYGVGWDIPALVLPFLVLCHGEYGRTKLLPCIKNIFTHLCAKGNFKELFLKSSELMLRLSEDDNGLDEDVVSDAGSDLDNVLGENDSDDEPYGSRLANEDPPIPRASLREATSKANQRARLRDVKLQILYELMRVSLSHIQTDYPSRFFKSAATTLLTIASDPDSDIPSLTTHLRNLFLFGRDFQMEAEGADESEARRTAHLLQNYVTHAAEVTMERVAIKWADRLYYQLVNKIALEEPKVRDAAYNTNLYTERINEAMARLAQLAQSYDLEVNDHWYELVLDAVKRADLSVDENEPEDILDAPSGPGLLLLATQVHFDGPRTDKISFHGVVSVCNALADSVHQSLGVRDALLYWVLWATTSATPEDVQSLAKDDYCHFLQLIFSIANSVSRETRHIAYSSVTKLLRLQVTEIAFEFLIDTFEYCPYDNVLDAAVQMLKVLSTGKVKCQIGIDTHQSKEIVGSCTPSGNLLVLDDKKKKQIISVVNTCVNDFIYDGDGVPLLLSWLNFLTVVDVDDTNVKEICSKLRNHLELKGQETLPDNVQNLIRLAIESLENARFK